MNYDVLLVTGNPDVRQDERMIMEEYAGLPAERIYVAGTLDEAIEVVKKTVSAEGRIGVIVTDLSHRGISIGTKLLDYVRASGVQIPVIIKSVRLASDCEATMLSMGAFAYDQKDNPVQDLVGKVQEALARKR
ncbi:hypothetical protein HYV85_01970 [Candidatus Woesearchaeota archaeon]|nr:hypothetical protein [Candidatus Woesearchaeota archaeon]